MGLTLTEKILRAHLVDGEPVKGQEIGIRIDQTLTQDATGTMAYLEFEAMGVPRVRTERSVAYIDHNTLQSGFENADDHRFIGSVCKKHGIYFSRPGNGICHQVHLERFGIPGKTLIGSDSHITPREVIRDFIELLDIVFQNPQINISEFIASDSMAHVKPSVGQDDQTDEEFAEFEI